MKITNGVKTYVIDDIYVSYTPYLRGILNLQETDTEGYIDLNMIDDSVLLEVPSDVLENFLNFLQGGSSIRMTRDDENFFDYMGIPNKYNYPLDYWAVKVRDNWIRDNMYKLDLFEDPYYGLIEVPTVRNEVAGRIYESNIAGRYMGTELFVAGGAPLYMVGGIDRLADIDIFFVTSREEAIEILASIYKMERVYITANSVGYREQGLDYTIYDNYQFILRLYQAPTEIVHGFDLDSVGFIYDGDAVYGTERAIYALNNKVNWFDPDRASPSYTNRLLKYHLRGYKIELPDLDMNRINAELVNSNIEDMMKLFFMLGNTYLNTVEPATTPYMRHLGIVQHELHSEPIRIADPAGYFLYLELELAIGNSLRNSIVNVGPLTGMFYLDDDGQLIDRSDAIGHGFSNLLELAGMSDYIDGYDVDMFPGVRDSLALWYTPGKYNLGQLAGVVNNMISRMVKNVNPHRSSRDRIDGTYSVVREKIFPNDEASRLILASAFDMVVLNDKTPSHDYLGHDVSNTILTPTTSIQAAVNDLTATKQAIRDGLDMVQFLSQNPMTQLTSTFHPEPVHNIQEFYYDSPYYHLNVSKPRRFPMRSI